MRRGRGAAVTLGLGALLGLASLVGCRDYGSAPPPPGEPPPLSFAADVQPILSSRCVACHAAGGLASFMPLTADQARANLVGQGSVTFPGELRVAPGDPDASVLYHRVAGTGVFGSIMPPPPSPPLEAGQVALIRDWIAQGARE